MDNKRRKRKDMETLVCLQCGEKFEAKTRLFCCDACEDMYEAIHSDPYSGIKHKCGIYRADIDYNGRTCL